MNAARLAGLALLLALAAPAQAQMVASALSVGGTHNCVVTPAGGVKCWGYNSEGQLGDGTLVDKSTPIDVPGLANVVAVAAGIRHTCVITTAGTVKCWGYNFNGQLGDNTTTNRSSPVDVGGGLTGVVSLAAGGGNTCALTSAGGVKCWGANFHGQAGNGDTTGVNRPTPVNVTGLTSGVIAIAANSDANCALTASGTVKCWGDNNGGGLGDGDYNTPYRFTPVNVVGATGVTALFSGPNADTMCVRVANGSIKCWGNNADGQLGIGSFENPDPNVPGIAVSLPGPVTSASASNWYTCAVVAGAVSCWGRNNQGELGDGGVSRNTPSTIAIASGIASVGAGGSHACALTLGGAVYCWGSGYGGANGDGTTTDRATPVEVTGFKPVVATMALGAFQTCAAGAGGAMWCLGYGFNGTLGDNSFSSSATAVMPIGFTTGTGSIAAGSDFTCGIVSGSLKCWGQSNTGQVGDNNIGIRAQPSSVVSLPASPPQMVAAGTLHACTVLTSGAVYCWGSNLSGAIGRDLSVGQYVLSPFAVPSLTSGVARITTGNFHTCVVTTGGGVKCWGDNSAGQLGNNTTNNTITPTDVTSLTSGVVGVQGGNNFTCARTTTGAVKCWGDNTYGQVGDGTNTRRLVPTAVSGLASSVAAIATGLHHACALLNTGDVKCWGENADGQLGDGSTTGRNVPTAVTGLGGRAVSISTGYRHTCARG
jgi:alpha-tubulin suppressor-like RCC1 family protein